MLHHCMHDRNEKGRILISEQSLQVAIDTYKQQYVSVIKEFTTIHAPQLHSYDTQNEPSHADAVTHLAQKKYIKIKYIRTQYRTLVFFFASLDKT